jgi:hypothetical protein
LEIFFIVLGAIALTLGIFVVAVVALGLSIIRNAPKWFAEAEYGDED